jgi:hypothetical protein
MMSADDGKILGTVPLAGGSDGATFNPATMEAFSSTSGGGGILTVIKENSPASFTVEENLPTMPMAKTLTFDGKTQHVLLIGAEQTPPPNPPPAGGRGGRGQMVPGSFSIVVVGK